MSRRALKRCTRGKSGSGHGEVPARAVLPKPSRERLTKFNPLLGAVIKGACAGFTRVAIEAAWRWISQ